MNNPSQILSDYQDGKIILIDKPFHWTSFDAVNKLRSIICNHFQIKKIKVGHSGTLDPLATGLLIICVGRATKQIDTFLNMEKEYVAELQLGATTPSFDLETEVTSTNKNYDIPREKIDEALKMFVGTISQIPPLYSAKQLNGSRAYEFARKGIEMKLDPVQVFIRELEIVEMELPRLVIRVSCSKGTYVRSLVRDIGEVLGCGAYLSNLRRTRIGEYSLENSITVDDFNNMLNNI